MSWKGSGMTPPYWLSSTPFAPPPPPAKTGLWLVGERNLHFLWKHWSRSSWSISLLSLWRFGVENFGQKRDIRLALLLHEAGLVQVLLQNRVLLPLLLHLDLLLRLALSEVPRLLFHLTMTNSFRANVRLCLSRDNIRRFSSCFSIYLLSVSLPLLSQLVQVSALLHVVQVEVCFSLRLWNFSPEPLV